MGGMRQKSEVGKSRYSFKSYVLKREKMSFQRLIGLRFCFQFMAVCCVHVGEQRAVISQKVRS